MLPLIELPMPHEGGREFIPTELELRDGVHLEGLTHVVAQSPTFPLLELNDRHFEVLAYSILRERAGPSTFYDQVSLLRTGPDKGRDVLLRRGAVTGIVQCKRKAARMGPDGLLVEILRLALYATRQPSLIPPPGTRYQVWTASGLTERAREFVDACDTDAVMQYDLRALFERARKGIASLALHNDKERDQAEQTQAIEIATGLVLEHVGPEDIATELAQLPSVRRQFFRTPDDGPAAASSREIDELVTKLREGQLERLSAAGRLELGRYVPRASFEQSFADFLGDPRRTFVAVGGSGQGKTSWVARLLASPPEGRMTILIPAEQIARSDRTPIDTIARLLTARPLLGIPPERIDQSIWKWLDAGNRILAVDGLDRARSDVREMLPAWIESAVGITRNASVRLVLTTRREAWSVIHAELPALKPSLFLPDETDEGIASFELNALHTEEAEELYRAYGVSAEQHRGARLTSPSLIALFSRMNATAPAIVTRSDILEEEFVVLERELRGAGAGPIKARMALSWIGDQLLGSPDGWIDIEGELPCTEALEILIGSDRLIHREGSVRMDSDDLAELLLSRRMALDRLTRDLDRGRKDPIFIGAASLVIAKFELEGETDAALGALLDDAPMGSSARLEAAASAILELRSPMLVKHRIQQAIALWNMDNVSLFASNLGVMINEVDLPARDRFKLILPLANGEDADDWRDKYWREGQAGRFFSPFVVAAEQAVLDDPAALLDDIIELSRDAGRLRSSIGRTLLFLAAGALPGKALSAAWSVRHDFPEAFRVTRLAAPVAAARFLAEVGIADLTTARFVVDSLWVIARPERLEELRQDGTEAVRDSVDRILNSIGDLQLKTNLLVLRLQIEQSPTLRLELDRLWSFVDDDLYWHALAAIGDEATARFAALLAGGEPGRDVDAILRAMSVIKLPALDPVLLVGPLRQVIQRTPSRSSAVALAVEAMLYTYSAPALPELEDFAVELAGSDSDDVRATLTYYAGSVVRGPATSEEIARRERLLDMLIDHETGSNVRRLVWKIIESSLERPNPQRHLNKLARRVGANNVRSEMENFEFLPGASELRSDFDLEGE